MHLEPMHSTYIMGVEAIPRPRFMITASRKKSFILSIPEGFMLQDGGAESAVAFLSMARAERIPEYTARRG